MTLSLCSKYNFNLTVQTITEEGGNFEESWKYVK